MNKSLFSYSIFALSLVLVFAFGATPSFVQAQSPQTYSLIVTHGTGGGFYTAGTVVRITADPAPFPDVIFHSWTDALVVSDGTSVPVANKTSQTTTLTMPAGATRVEAQYSLIIPSLQVSITSPQNGANFTVGTGFSVSGQITGGQPPYNYSIVFENNRNTSPTWSSNTVSANFTPTSSGQKPITFYIEDSNGAHIAETSITVNVNAAPPPATYQLTVFNGTGDGSYTAGTAVPITADVAPAGQVFDRWTGATVANPTAQTTTITMPAGAATVTATYKAITVTSYAVSILKSGTGSGTVTSTGSINCGSVCNSSGTAGMTVNLSATEASGSTFSGWSGGACDGSTIASCSFILNTDTTVTATFTAVVVEPPPPVTVSPENPGDSVREIEIIPEITEPLLPVTVSPGNSGDSGQGIIDWIRETIATLLRAINPSDSVDGQRIINPDDLSEGNRSGVLDGQLSDSTKLDSGSDSTGITDGCGGPLFLTLSGFLARIQCILNLFIPFIIGLALLVIIFGIFLYVAKADNEEKRQEGRRFVVWGLAGLFFMLSVWGFVNILIKTFDVGRAIQPGDIPVVPTILRTPNP